MLENAVDLVDIRDVDVDKNLPKNERIAEYIRQIKDPYLFRCGDTTISAIYKKDGPPLEDCLGRIVL